MGWITRLLHSGRPAAQPRTRDSTRIAVTSLRKLPEPIPCTLDGPGDRLTLTLSIDILALELLHDRQTAVDEAVRRAGLIITRQLDVSRMRSELPAVADD